MSHTGVTLDFSKAQPLSLDFSKAQGLDGKPLPPDPANADQMFRSGPGAVDSTSKNLKMDAGQPSYTMRALEATPSGADPHNPGNPNSNAIPESARADVNRKLSITQGAMIPAAEGANALIEGGVPAALKFGRGLIGSAAGATAGAYGGGKVGGLFGQAGEKVGEAVGGLGGGIIGGGAAAGLGRNPTTTKINPLPFSIQRAIPEWMVPGGVPEGELARGSFMNRGYAQVGDPVRIGQEDLGEFMNRGYAPANEAATDSAIAEGRAAKLPTRMPKTPEPVDQTALAVRENRAAWVPKTMPQQVDPVREAVREGTAARLPVRMPQAKPTLAPRSSMTLSANVPESTQAFIPRDTGQSPLSEFLGRQRESLAVTQNTPPSQTLTKSGLPEVIRSPIMPESQWRNTPAGDVKNIPRAQLPSLLNSTGDPAIVNELRRLGSNVLYVPEEYGGSSFPSMEEGAQIGRRRFLIGGSPETEGPQSK